MKSKFLLIIGFLLFSLQSFADDIYVNSPLINPNPSKKNQTVTLSFNFINTGAAIPLGALPTRITISLRKLDPELVSGTPVVTSSDVQGVFTWSYNSGDMTITGTQVATIPQDAATAFSFSAVVNAETAQGSASSQGHGMNVNIVPGSTVINNNTSNDAVQVYTYTDGVLPVVFGPINATLKGNSFNINWQTSSEKNNKEFVVQVSADGKEFHTVGTVASIAKDGNSDTALDYAFSKTWNEISSLLGFPLMAGLLIAAFGMALLMKNRRKVYYIPALLILAFASFIGCRKDEKQVDTGDVPDVYVRIGQVDIDGTTEYSRVVKAIKE